MPRHRIPERRERLLVAARELALEQGWPATTVSGIAERVGIGKGAVYLEFANKAAILDALVNRGMGALGAEVRRRVLEADGVIGLSAVYRFSVEALLADRLMRAFFLGDEDVLGGHVRSVADGRYQQRFDWLNDYLAHLQQAGLIAAGVDLPSVARMLSVFTIGLLHAPGTLGATADEELRRSVELFSGIVERGVAAAAPADADAAREAQLAMIERLEAQLEQLHSPREETG